MFHVRRGDQVVVTKGREKGKRGKVKHISEHGRLEIEKIGMVKRHTRPTQKMPQGGIIDKEGSIAVANVALWCDKCAAPRRSRASFDDKGGKGRVCVKCGTEFPAAAL